MDKYDASHSVSSTKTSSVQGEASGIWVQAFDDSEAEENGIDEVRTRDIKEARDSFRGCF